MKKYFEVTFERSSGVYCTNIAHAESAEAVEANYAGYEWISVRECEESEVETARRKGMPIVEIETPEAITEEAEITKEEETEMEHIFNGKTLKPWDGRHNGYQYNAQNGWDLYRDEGGTIYYRSPSNPREMCIWCPETRLSHHLHRLWQLNINLVTLCFA